MDEIHLKQKRQLNHLDNRSFSIEVTCPKDSTIMNIYASDVRSSLFAAELFFDRQNNSWTKALRNAVSEEAYQEDKEWSSAWDRYRYFTRWNPIVGIFKDGQPDGMGILNLPMEVDLWVL